MRLRLPLHQIYMWKKHQTLKDDSRRPGHARGKQARLSNWAPPQAPSGRASLKMSLCRNKEPRPQDTLHALHAVHGDMMQSTRGEGSKNYKDFLVWSYYHFRDEHTSYRSLSHPTHLHSPSSGHTCGPGEHTPRCYRRTAWGSRGWAPGGAVESPLV